MSATCRPLFGIKEVSFQFIQEIEAGRLAGWTGATGLVGSRLVSRLIDDGHKVRVMSRNPNSAQRHLSGQGIRFFGPQEWSDAVRGSDAVVNLAGMHFCFQTARQSHSRNTALPMNPCHC